MISLHVPAANLQCGQSLIVWLLNYAKLLRDTPCYPTFLKFRLTGLSCINIIIIIIIVVVVDIIMNKNILTMFHGRSK